MWLCISASNLVCDTVSKMYMYSIEDNKKQGSGKRLEDIFYLMEPSSTLLLKDVLNSHIDLRRV